MKPVAAPARTGLSRRTMGVRDAKAHLSELLRDAQQGREWTITERGRPIARIAPLGEPPASNEERLRRLEREGLIEARGAHVRPLPPPLPLGRGLAQRLLDEDRRA